MITAVTTDYHLVVRAQEALLVRPHPFNAANFTLEMHFGEREATMVRDACRLSTLTRQRSHVLIGEAWAEDELSYAVWRMKIPIATSHLCTAVAGLSTRMEISRPVLPIGATLHVAIVGKAGGARKDFHLFRQREEVDVFAVGFGCGILRPQKVVFQPATPIVIDLRQVRKYL